MIGLNETAAGKVIELIEKRPNQTAGLRVGVRGGGCSGFTYFLEFVESGNTLHTSAKNACIPSPCPGDPCRPSCMTTFVSHNSSSFFFIALGNIRHPAIMLCFGLPPFGSSAIGPAISVSNPFFAFTSLADKLCPVFDQHKWCSSRVVPPPFSYFTFVWQLDCWQYAHRSCA